MTDSVIITNREATYVVENIGEVGPQGETGATGAPGPQGIQGIQGERGSDGIQGPQGETGAAGTSVKIMGTVNTVLDLPSSANPGEGYVVTEDGDVYFYAVLTGWTSAGQIVGPAGPTGPQGPRGDQGIQGIQGEQGIQGVQGSAGTSIEIMGEVATVGDLPASADSGEGYICSADGDLYFYTPGSGWVSAGQVVGPQGPQGIQGEQGPQGIQGEAGADAPVDTYLPLTGGTLTGSLLGTTISAGTSLGITGGPTWTNDAGKWKTTAHVRVDGNIYAVGGSILFGGASDVTLARTGSAAATLTGALTVTGATTLTGTLTANGVVALSGSQHTIKNGVPATLNFAKGSQWGYSSGYRAIILGDTAGSPNNVTVAIGYDPVGNANGSFTGNGSEVLFRNAVEFTTPNAADNAWLKPLKFDSSGNTTLLGLTAGTTSLTGDLTISKAAATARVSATSGMSILSIEGAAGQWRELAFKTGTTYRWSFDVDTSAESGSNAGSNLALYRYNDAGGVGGTPLLINRATGLTTLTSLAVTGNSTFAGILDVSSGPLRVTASGAYMQLNANAGGTGVFYFTGATGTSRGFMMQTASVHRWKFGVSADPESSSDAGSNFYIDRYSDAGASIGAALTITRSTGAVTLTGSLTVNGTGKVAYMASPSNGQIPKWNGSTGEMSWSGLSASGSTLYFSGNIFVLGTSGPQIMSGTGSPEGVVTAPVSSTWHRTDGGAGTSFYVKESGTGNTGWVAK